MATTQIDERAQAREVKTQTDAAVACALAQDWRKAVEANRAVLRIVPNNIEALNRLAKALLELGELAEARDAVDGALQLNSTNTIARRNRERLERAEAAAPLSRQKKRARQSKPATTVKEAEATYDSQPTTTDPQSSAPNVFSAHLLMSEEGKSTIATLIDATDRTAVGHLSSGETLTLTDVAVAAGIADIGDRGRVTSLPGALVERVVAEVHGRLYELADRMKSDASAVPLIAVGGGAMLVPDEMEGIAEVVRVEHHAVANAVGAAIAQISGEVDRIFQERSELSPAEG